MKTVVRVQSEKKEDIDLYLELLSGSAKKINRFDVEGLYTATFRVDFRALHKIVTNKSNVTNIKGKVKKQDTSINKELSALVGLYKSNGKSLQVIADKLNKDGFTNSRGNKINKEQVNRLYKKYKAEAEKGLKKS